MPEQVSHLYWTPIHIKSYWVEIVPLPVDPECSLLYRLKRGSISTRRCRKISPDTRRKKRNSTVVKKPPAKFRVPVNSCIKRVGPRAEAAAFGDGPVLPKSSTCCKNRCSVLMGSR